MIGVNSVLNLGRKALSASQSALNTVAHNISNANTPGFSRQEVNFEADVPESHDRNFYGSGVRVGHIVRFHDAFVERELCNETNKQHFYETLENGLNRVEDTFNEFDGKGLSTAIASFFDGFRALAMQPESTLSRQSVVTNSKILTDRFNHIYSTLQTTQYDLDSKLQAFSKEASELCKNVADLNLEIRKLEISGRGTANDLRDQRDVAVLKLSEMINIRVVVDEEDSYTIDAEGLGTLVVKNNAMELVTVRAKADKNSGKVDGLSDLYIRLGGSGSQRKVTTGLTGGSIGAILKLRDQVIPKMVNRINDMAENIALETNNLQKTGVGLNGEPGLDLFRVDHEIGGAASIKINEVVAKDVSRISAGVFPDARGDNRIALATAGLQNKRFMHDGQTTLEEDYNDFLADVSIQTNSARQNAGNQADLVRQLENYKLSQVAVNLDDEAIKMIRYQQMYGAAAKLIQTSDQMIQTVLDIKR